MKLFAFLFPIFGFVLRGLYGWVGNYGVAVILLTLITRILMLPMSVKQQKSTAKMQRLQSKVRKIQQQYAGDQRKIQEETQALYSREGTNPMSMGCLPLLLQLPIIYGLIGVIYYPLQYVLQIPAESITALSTALSSEAVKPHLAADVLTAISGKSSDRMIEFYIIESIDKIRQFAPNAVSADVFTKIENLDFNFLGLSLGQVPNIKHPDLLWSVPILSFLSQMASSVVMYLRQKQQNPEMSKNPSMGCMTFGMPLMSLWFTFQFPVGIGVYWITSSVIAFVQMMALNYFYSPKKTTAKLLIEETVQRRSREQNLKRVAERKNTQD